METRSKSNNQRINQRQIKDCKKQFTKLLFNQQQQNTFIPQKKVRAYGQYTFNKKNGENIRLNIQKINSFQERSLVKMKSVIEELSSLITPRQDEEINLKKQTERENQDCQNYFLKGNWNEKDKDKESANEAMNQLPVEQCKAELSRVNKLYETELTKNKDLVKLVNKLQHYSRQVDKQINCLLLSCADYEQKLQKGQKQFKRQILINLQLQELLIKNKIKIQNSNTKQLKLKIATLEKTFIERERYHHAEITKIIKQFQEAKTIGQKQINQLNKQLILKKQEITRFNYLLKQNHIQIQTSPSPQYTQTPQHRSPQPQLVSNQTFGQKFKKIVREHQENIMKHTSQPKQSVDISAIDGIPMLEFNRRKGSLNMQPRHRPQKWEISESIVTGQINFLKHKNIKLQQLLKLNQNIYDNLKDHHTKIVCRTDRI